MTQLFNIISRSKLGFLKKIEFTEITPGRFFQKTKIDLGNGWKQFFVILGPNIESPMHNHENQNMEETHMLLYGSGKFVIYDKDSKQKELILSPGEFHEIFSTFNNSPNHKYIAGPKGSVTLTLEHFDDRAWL